MSSGQESRCTAGMPVFRRCHKYVGRGFHRKILIEKIHARYIVIGTDFTLGMTSVVMQKCLQNMPMYGYELFVIEKRDVRKTGDHRSSYVRKSFGRKYGSCE